MSLSDGLAWEKEYGWIYKDKKMFKVDCVVTEIRNVCLEAETREEFESKLKELGYRIAPMSVPIETSISRETMIKY